MDRTRIARLALIASWIAPLCVLAQGWDSGAISDRYIQRQQERLEQSLRDREADIESDFAQEQSFRIRMKEQRLDFERMLVRQRRAFLESLRAMKIADRGRTVEAFYARLQARRKEFNERRKAESRGFWEERARQRQQLWRHGANDTRTARLSGRLGFAGR